MQTRSPFDPFHNSPAAFHTDPDQTLIAFVNDARRAYVAYAMASAEAEACFSRVEVDPEFLANGTRLEEVLDRVFSRHGYDVACDLAGAAWRALAPLLERLLQLRPRTLRGAALHTALVIDLVADVNIDLCGRTEFYQTIAPTIAARLRGLAGAP
jgi:hypothetical protein